MMPSSDKAGRPQHRITAGRKMLDIADQRPVAVPMQELAQACLALRQRFWLQIPAFVKQQVKRVKNEVVGFLLG
jgi:hypothetical protein